MDSVDYVQCSTEMIAPITEFNYTILVYGRGGNIEETHFRGTAAQRTDEKKEVCDLNARHAAGYIDGNGKIQIAGNDDTLKNELKTRLKRQL